MDSSARSGVICPFCNGDCTFSYKMDNYSIYKCARCGTGQTYPMPSHDELTEFYDGFMFAANEKNYEQVKCSFDIFLQYLKMAPQSNLRMLDIGGGGGFHAKAFEQLMYGESCFIDLDPQSCNFARSVGLKNVVCGDVENPDNIDGEFDLIFARHLIEHLVSPSDFIENISRYLRKGGQLVLLFPNGESKEYLSIIPYTLQRLFKVLCSNKWSMRLLRKALFTSIHHGIDPPRHLWAISCKGIEEFCVRNGYHYQIETFRVDSEMVSPYFKKGITTFIHSLFGRMLARQDGGAHLLCVIANR